MPVLSQKCQHRIPEFGCESCIQRSRNLPTMQSRLRARHRRLDWSIDRLVDCPTDSGAVDDVQLELAQMLLLIGKVKV